MKRLFCAPAVCLLFALCFAACSSTADGPPVAANSNQAVVVNSNTAASTTATANANLAATPPATTAPVATSPTPVANANTNAAPTAAATPAKSPTAAADFTAARAQYAQHCAMCHGAGGEGMKMGTVNYPSLKGGSSASHSDAQLNNYITNGHEGMPAFKGKLSAAQISTMVRYIRQELQGKK